MLCFAKIIPECRHATRSFQGRKNFVELGHFNNFFSKTQNYITTFQEVAWKIYPKVGHRAFFPKIRAFFFLIFKKGQGWAGEDCICQSSGCLKMAQCALMSLNMPEHGLLLLNVTKYAWKYLFWLCQGCQCASSSKIFDRVLNMP